MSKRTALVIATVTLSLFGVTNLVTAQKPRSLKHQELVSQEELRQKQREKARQEATPVEEAAVTQRQKEHGKLYNGYNTGRKLRDLTATVGDLLLRRDVGLGGGDPEGAPADLQKSLEEMAYGADAVVTGVMKNKSSQLTESEEYVFTDYEVAVDDVLKDNSASPIEKNDRFTITRPGGTILLNGRVVQAIDESYQPLVKGATYLFFLQYIPSTGGYQALNSRAVFQLGDGKVAKLTKEPFALDDADASSFVDRVRGAVTRAADRKVKGGAK